MAGGSTTMLRGRALWLAGGFLGLGLMWPDLVSCFSRAIPGGGGDPDSGHHDHDADDGMPSWQLVEDTGGFRTYISKVPGSGALSLRGETVVNEHIGKLYTAFLNTTSTLDWVRFLVEVEELPVAGARKRKGESPAAGSGSGSAGKNGGEDTLSNGGDGGVLFQRYDMPWPVKDREVVLRRSVRLDKRAKRVVATYQSTEHPARPVTSAAVRAVVYKTSWILTSMGGSKTAIDFETRTDPKGALPTAIVGFMQKKFPRDTVSGFVRSAKGVAVHSAMTKW